MDPRFEEALRRGVEALRLPVDEPAMQRLARFAERLLAWNRRLNLTAITDPAEMAEKHFVDSLALVPVLGQAKTLLDLGSGAGLPGMAVACARMEIEVTCCDSVAKKVAFVKALSAELSLRVRGIAARAEGNPEREGLPRADAVVSRAVSEPARWIPLGVRYLAEDGRLLAMLGKECEEGALREIGRGYGLELEELVQFKLPISGAQRAIARWRSRPRRP
jgi:16S rRNA (guanine527-N7)-methyltransferase